MRQYLTTTLFICYIAIVSYLCLGRPDGIMDIGRWDKLMHTLAYIGFALFCSIVARHQKQFLVFLLLAASYGVLIEYLQGLTGYRQASIGDGVANIAGLMIGVLLVSVVHRIRPLAAMSKAPGQNQATQSQ